MSGGSRQPTERINDAARKTADDFVPKFTTVTRSLT